MELFTDSSRTTRLEGTDRYSGRRGENNFPTTESPLRLTCGRFVAHFHSDGSNQDWGVRFCVRPAQLHEIRAEPEACAPLSTTVWPLIFPEATKVVRFKFLDSSRTYPEDVVEIFSTDPREDPSAVPWQLSAHSGGMGESERRFPGLDEVPPVLFLGKACWVRYRNESGMEGGSFRYVRSYWRLAYQNNVLMYRGFVMSG